MVTRRIFSGCLLCAGLGLIAEGASAQAPSGAAPGMRRQILDKQELTGTNYVTLRVLTEVDPGFLIPRHTHPGIESSFLLEGSGKLGVKGMPDRIVSAGEGFEIPYETPHLLQNSDKPARIATTYTVDKDKPLATPAPE